MPRRLFPECAGLHTIAASVADPHLLDAIPGDTPVLVVAEGSTAYLRATDGVAMLRRITEHFPSGEMVFDGYGRLGVWITQRYGPVKATGAELDWAIDDPRELESEVAGMVFDTEWRYPTMPEIACCLPWSYRQFLRILFGITPIRRLGRCLRYHF